MTLLRALPCFLFLSAALAHAAGDPPAAATTKTLNLPTRPAQVIDAPLLRTNYTPAELSTACEQVEKDADNKLADLVALPADKRTFANSFAAFDAIVADYNETVWRLSFMKDIHPDAAVRDAAAACEERAGKYSVALSARKDLYLALKGTLDQQGKQESLDDQQRRLVDLTMLDFKRNGLMLSDKDRQKLIEIRSRLTELQTRFQKNLNDDKTSFIVSKEELAGLSDDFITAHEQKDKKGSYVLTIQYPDYYPVMENARIEATRKKMEVAFMNKGGKENLKLLDEALRLRAQASKLLGYRTHADYVAEDRMAKDGATIRAFLARMKKGLKPLLAAETEKMAQLKATELKTKTATIHAWDWRYYMNQVKKRDYTIDDEAVRAYFPADKVLAGMFEVYAKLFAIQIVEVPLKDAWAAGVKLYEIKDARTKQLLAKFYADLYPREGKYGHAAEFTLTPGRVLGDAYRIPMACLVVNFAPPKNGAPARLSMKEVETLFHEFGHVVHESLTTARYASQAGTRTALDFVEAPSQVMENWAYQPEVLALISADPTDPKKPLPTELAQKLLAARKYNAGVHYSRQVFLGSFDHAIHTSPRVAADATAKKLWASILGFPEDKSAHFAGTFGHMMGGYDGGYYGYLWSEVFAADMFSRFAGEGILNQTTGVEYRDRVIARGRTVEPSVLLEDFLGRPPNEGAFLRMTGLSPEPASSSSR